MKRISRREFNLLAVAGAAVVAPLSTTYALASRVGQEPSAADAKPKARPALTAEQAKKVEEEIGKREEQMASIRGRTLPYGLEPAFVFHVQATPHAPVSVQRKG